MKAKQGFASIIPLVILGIGLVIAVFLLGQQTGWFNRASELKSTTTPITSQPPAGFWKFDEKSGSTAVDSSVSNNNGQIVDKNELTQQGAWTTGHFKNALVLDGIGEHVLVKQPITNNAFSICSWIKTSSLGGVPHIIS